MGSSIDIQICQYRDLPPFFLIEYAHDGCEGHEITPSQARELHAALDVYLARLDAAGVESDAVWLATVAD